MKVLPQCPALDYLHEAKKVQVNFVKLTYLSDDENAVLTSTTDVTSNAVGVVLQQNINEENKSISFYFLKTNLSQMQYSTFFRELILDINLVI